MLSIKRILPFTLLVVGLIGCKKKKEDQEEFQKGPLLENVGSNIIIPSYQNLYAKLTQLESTYQAFQLDLTEPKLSDVKLAWREAYLSWQDAFTFEFGPAMNSGLRTAVGTFPSDTTKIMSNITNGGYVLGAVTNIDAVGFSSLDFLLYRENAMNDFTFNAAYRNYTLEVIQKMKSEAQATLSAWNNGYLATFKASTGTESTSAFSLLVNEFNKSYEICKNAKLGIPIGKQSLGIQRPEYLEARKSAISLELLRQSIVSLKNLFNGGSGVGFDDYLNALERQSLVTSINAQFSAIIAHIDGISGTLEQEMNGNPANLDALYTKMQGLVVSIKTDMASAFGVLITYQDNDGD